MSGKSYTQSKSPTNNWDGDDLDLLGATSKQFVNGLFENKNCAAVACIRNDGEFMHLFCPMIADKILEDDSVEKGALVIGNAVDDTTYLQPIKVEASDLFGHSIVFIKKSEAHPVFKLHKNIPPEFLKGTDLEGEKDIIAAFIPNAVPYQFKSKIAYGNIGDDEVQRCFAQLGGEYAAWAKCMKMMHENYDDFKEIMANIKSKGQEKTLVSAELGSGINISNMAPYLNISIIRDHSEFEGLKLLKKEFGPRTPPKATSSAPAPGLTASALKSSLGQIVLSRPEDEEKAKKAKTGKNKLSIFFAATKERFNINDMSKLEPCPPVFSELFEEILDSKDSESSKAEELQSLIENSFTDDPKLTDDITKSTLQTARSLVSFPKAAASLLLGAKFSTSPASSLIKDTATLGPQALLYQDNKNNKADIKKDQENLDDAEEILNVPDAQRSKKKATIEVIGKMTNMKEVLGNMANILTLCITLIDLMPGNPIPMFYSLISILYNFFSAPGFTRYAVRHEAEHPYLHCYIWTVVQTVWIGAAQCAACSPNQQMVKKNNYSGINLDHFRVIAENVKSVLTEFRTLMFNDTHCPHIPKITPFELNPVAQEKKRIADMLAGTDSNDAKRSKTSTDTEMTEATTSNGNGGGNKSGKKNNGGKRSTNQKKEKKSLGFIVPDDTKPALTPGILFPRSLGLSKAPCIDFCCQGRECNRSNDDCNFDHSTFMKIDADDRKKILKHLADTKCAKMNRNLLSNPKAKEIFDEHLSEQQKSILFSTGASNE